MGEVHPLWRPYERPTPEEIRRAQVGERTPVPGGRVEVAAPDPTWPARYDEVARQVRDALGERVLDLQHIGSTSVAGLHAKPVIDLDLTVADSADEASYLPDLEAAGFTLRVREPDWEEHRCLRGADPVCNLHVFSPGAVEPQRTPRLPRLAARARRRPGGVRRAQARPRDATLRLGDGLQRREGRAGLRDLRADLRRRPGAPAHAAAAGLSGYCWVTPVIVTLVAGGPSYPSGLPLVAAFAAFCATLSPAGVSWPNCV